SIVLIAVCSGERLLPKDRWDRLLPSERCVSFFSVCCRLNEELFHCVSQGETVPAKPPSPDYGLLLGVCNGFQKYFSYLGLLLVVFKSLCSLSPPPACDSTQVRCFLVNESGYLIQEEYALTLRTKTC
ncbi:unnamed protein product, partial [Coccothraustes coccothraustes]